MIEVLIIEDDPMVAKFNGLYLESIDGFKVAGFAKSAEEGLALLKNQQIDLILLDVYMGGQTGLDLLFDLRKEANPVDVIIISAANDKKSIQTALRFGAVDYLIKPFSFERFQEALLQYKQKFQVLNNDYEVSQVELDSFLLKSNRQQKLNLKLPKGLTVDTLSLIVSEIIKFSDQSFSSAVLANASGVSRVSVRKYLNHLVEGNFLEMTVVYQKTGRPLSHFSIQPGKVEMLEQFLI